MLTAQSSLPVALAKNWHASADMEATLTTSFARHVLVVGDVVDKLCMMGMTAHRGKGVLRSAGDQALAYHVTRARLPFLLPFVGKLSSRACLQDKKAMGKSIPVACLTGHYFEVRPPMLPL